MRRREWVWPVATIACIALFSRLLAVYRHTKSTDDFIASLRREQQRLVLLHPKAYQQGVRDAEREIELGEECFLVYDDEGYFLDRETGLPVRGTGYGRDDDKSAQVSGHNDRIEKEIATHGLPKSSRKRFEDVLYHLRNYTMKAGPPIALGVDVPHTSPDGAYRFFLHRSNNKKPHLPYELHDLDTRTGKEIGDHDSEDPGCFVWGPPGCDVAIIIRNSGIPIIYDLRAGSLMLN